MIILVRWKLIERNEEKLGRFKVIKDRLELPNEKQINFSFLNFSDGVCILPIVKKDNYLVINQYRHAVGMRQWEFPAGMIDEGLTPLQAAQKELLEETGYEAQEWIDLGMFHPSAGSTSEKIYLFAARNLSKGEQNLELTEDISVSQLDEEKLIELITSNDFQHGGGMAAFLKYKIWLSEI